MSTDLSRRRTLQLLGGVSAAALGGCAAPPDRLKPDPAAAVQQIHGIDVHCHIFNARDIPVVRFLENVELPELGLIKLTDFDRRVLLPRIEFLAYGVEALAKSFEAESKALDIIEKQPEREFGAEFDFPTLAELRTACQKSQEERDKQAGVKGGITDFSFFDRFILLPIAELFEPVDVLMDWIRLLAGYRFRIIRQLSSLFSASNVRLNLYTPSTVDYDFWLGENSLPMQEQTELYGRLAKLHGRDFLVNGFVAFDPLRQALYEAVNAATPSGRRLETPLEMVQGAVDKKGFLGIKLYPPMGFKPIGNSGLDRSAFEPVRERLWQLICTPPAMREDDQRVYSTQVPGNGYGTAIVHPVEKALTYRTEPLLAFPRDAFDRFFDEVATHLDAALHKLYQWCVQADVAVMAHCSNSQGAHLDPDHPDDIIGNYGLRASPDFWADVLATYPTLRLNIGHFGGIWNKGLSDAELNGSSNEDKWARASANWPDKVISLLTDPRYPNVYTDFADWSEAILSHDEALAYMGQAHADRAFEFLHGKAASMADGGARLLSRIMYGTDWIMLGRAEDVEGYLRGLSTRMNAHFGWPQTAALLRGNAVDFLGLRKGGSGYERLRRFYAGSPDHLLILDGFST